MTYSTRGGSAETRSTSKTVLAGTLADRRDKLDLMYGAVGNERRVVAR